MQLRTAVRALCCVLLTAGGAAYAEIYQSKDAAGNTVFSDTPTEDSEPVKLQKENIADSVKPRPPAPAAEPERKAPQGAAAEPAESRNRYDEARDDGDEYPMVDDDREEWLEDEAVEARRREAAERAAERRSGDAPHAAPLPANPHMPAKRR